MEMTRTSDTALGFHFRILACGAAFALLAGCSETKLLVHTAKSLTRDDGGSARGTYKVGNPYRIGGVWYYPNVDYRYRETGIASWYGPKFHGNRTANGERFDQNAITAAHRTLPLPSMVRVTNLENGRALRIRVNDRGPYAHGRIIDLSRRAAQLLGFSRKGTAKVRIEILPDESRQLAMLYRNGRNQVQIARANGNAPVPSGRPAVRAAPRMAVTKAPLEPVGEGKSVPRRESPAGTAPPKAPDREAGLEPQADGQVTQEPVSAAPMYIQAGAFAQFDNANRLRARLSVLGRTEVVGVMYGEQQLFRVRVGPIRRLRRADAILERLIGAGYTQAQIVVDG
ncbi:MAG: septal ring lytic transglycosylase RlpA family protein [Alphaproteobacteria bacterium]|nr:septal ring lytic transglycosylase RlpA family protein [Alphaproteobacteria bacterium]